MAEVEIFHSRPVAPTRRVALGDANLPSVPTPGFGGILLAGVAAAFVPAVDRELLGDLYKLADQLERGSEIPQPRLRHRFQADTVGLTPHRHRLHGEGDSLRFEFDHRGNAAPNVLGALYAAGRMPAEDRPAMFEVIRRGLRWRGEVGRELVDHLARAGSTRDWVSAGGIEPVAWALGVFGLDTADADGAAVQQRFRELLRQAHPDHGGASESAAERIGALTKARRILLSAS